MNTSPKAPRTHELEKQQFEHFRGIAGEEFVNSGFNLKHQLRAMTKHAETLELELIEAQHKLDLFEECRKGRERAWREESEKGLL